MKKSELKTQIDSLTKRQDEFERKVKYESERAQNLRDVERLVAPIMAPPLDEDLEMPSFGMTKTLARPVRESANDCFCGHSKEQHSPRVKVCLTCSCSAFANEATEAEWKTRLAAYWKNENRMCKCGHLGGAHELHGGECKFHFEGCKCLGFNLDETIKVELNEDEDDPLAPNENAGE